jgi:hypothetical protein
MSDSKSLSREAVLALAVAIAGGYGCQPRSPGTDAGTEAGSATDATSTDATSTDAAMAPCLPGGMLLFAGQTLDFSFCPGDPQIGDLGTYGLNPADVVAAFEAADPTRAPYDFAGFGSRWAVLTVPDPSAMVAASVLSGELDVAILCIEPFTTIFHVNDDLAGMAPTAGLDLLVQGPWTCMATTSPHTDLVPGNTPLGPATFQVVQL